MKKILVFLGILISLKSVAQYPVNQSLGSDSTLVTSKGGLKSRIVNTPFTDTTQANLQRIRQYPGAQIFTTSDNLFWLRNSGATGWINAGGGGGGGITQGQLNDTAAAIRNDFPAGAITDTTHLSDRINLKQNLITLTTTGSSGASTFDQGTGALNIPNYSGGGGSYINNSTSLQASANFNIAGYGRTGDSLITRYSRIGNLGTQSGFARIFQNIYDSSSLVAADGDRTIIGVGTYPQVNKTSGVDANGTLCGLCAEAMIGPRNTSNWSSAIGSVAVRGSINIQPGATGTLTNAESLFATGDISAMTITNRYGLWSENPYVHGTGAITNNYGIYVQNQTAGTNNWNIYAQGAAPNYFGGATTFAALPTFSTLTAGSIPYAGTAGIMAQDNANLFWNATTKRLGIGTATPNGQLEINKSQNAETGLYVLNANTGTGAFEDIIVGESTSGGKYGYFAYFNNSFTASGLSKPNTAALFGSNTGGLSLIAANAAGFLTFGTGGTAAANERMRITAAGGIVFPATNTATGTTGAQTINKPTGTVNFATGASTLVVTNSLVTANSLVFAVVRTNDASAIIKNVVPAAGSFTITLNAATGAETSVGFWVINN